VVPGVEGNSEQEEAERRRTDRYNGKRCPEPSVPQMPPTRRRRDGLAVIRLNAMAPAGRTAGAISHTLRNEQVRDKHTDTYFHAVANAHT